MRRFFFALCVLLGLSLGPLAGAALALPGSLDPSFGTGGYAVVDFGSGTDKVLRAAVQPDGSVLSICSESGTYWVVRYTPSGQLDGGFGVGGRVALPWSSPPFETFDATNWAQGRVVFTQPTTGRILVAAKNEVVAFTAQGQLDLSFAAAGVLTAPLAPAGWSYWGPYRHEMAPDGTIVAIGTASAAGRSDTDLLVMRFTVDGLLDPSFANGGVYVKDLLNHSGDSLRGAMVDHGGRILLAGGLQGDHFLLRLLSDGSPDAGFGSGGLIAPNAPAEVYAMVELSDGTIMCASGGTGGLGVRSVVRILAEGSVDSAYSTISTSLGTTTANSYAILADGTVVIAGPVDNGYPTYADFALRRFTSLGLADETFAPDGRVTIDFGASDDIGTAIFRPDGRIIVGGSAYVAGASSPSSLPGARSRAAASQKGIIFQLLGGSRTGLSARLVKSPSASLVSLRLKGGRASWKVSGRLTCGKSPVGAAKLSLLRSPNAKKWTTAFSKATDKTGTSATTVKFTHRGTYYFRWSFRGTSAYRAVTSTRTKVVVK